LVLTDQGSLHECFSLIETFSTEQSSAASFKKTLPKRILLLLTAAYAAYFGFDVQQPTRKPPSFACTFAVRLAPSFLQDAAAAADKGQQRRVGGNPPGRIFLQRAEKDRAMSAPPISKAEIKWKHARNFRTWVIFRRRRCRGGREQRASVSVVALAPTAKAARQSPCSCFLCSGTEQALLNNRLGLAQVDLSGEPDARRDGSVGRNGHDQAICKVEGGAVRSGS